MITLYGEPETLATGAATTLNELAKQFEPPVFVVVLRGLEAGAVLANDARVMQELRGQITTVIDAHLEKCKAARSR